MSGAGISLATKGIICKPSSVTQIDRIVMPFNIKLNIDNKKLNITRTGQKKISIKKEDIKSANFEIESKSLNVNNKSPKMISIKRV